MALAKCTDCGKMASTTAATCPNCGAKNPTKSAATPTKKSGKNIGL